VVLIVKTSFFKSIEKDGFVWTETDSVTVEILSGTWNGVLFFNGEETTCTNTPK